MSLAGVRRFAGGFGSGQNLIRIFSRLCLNTQLYDQNNSSKQFIPYYDHAVNILRELAIFDKV